MTRSRRCAVLALVALLGTAGCMVRLSPRRVELTRSTRPPIYRVGKITEDITGSWAEEAKAKGWGGKEVVAGLLRQSEAASLFSNDPNNLAVDIHMVSSHEDDHPRIAWLAMMSICTLGLMPLHFRTEWSADVTVTLRTPDGEAVEERGQQAKGAYDIWALPPTMFTLGAAGVRGVEDGLEVRNRISRKAVADWMAIAEQEYDRMARVRQAWAIVADQRPISVQAGDATLWVTYTITPAKEGGRRQYVLQFHQTQPLRGAAPWRTVVAGDAGLAADSPWRWRDLAGAVLAAEGRLWTPAWKVEEPQGRLLAVQLTERKVAARELLRVASFPDLSPADWNGVLLAWKNRELVALLRNAATDDLREHVVQMEELAVKASEAAEREKDEAQRLVADGKPGASLHTEAARAYTTRIEILKPLLAAIRKEIADRGK